MARKAPSPVAAKNSSAVPNPPTARAVTWRTRSKISSELIPTTIRCAAKPDRPAATVGSCTTVRAPCSQPVTTA
ncbi:Uncharacterised protein [Mycobacterium tuberculosis]|uniref:Uncharacterized protein n=1 Tax=Mycobacterium tuberculosis TaxID=1773 RepID=A0A0U0R3N3_MYCTX|nr:Uncharacterised protein [Mycobacterium tuberculosis]